MACHCAFCAARRVGRGWQRHCEFAISSGSPTFTLKVCSAQNNAIITKALRSDDRRVRMAALRFANQDCEDLLVRLLRVQVKRLLMGNFQRILEGAESEIIAWFDEQAYKASNRSLWTMAK